MKRTITLPIAAICCAAFTIAGCGGGSAAFTRHVASTTPTPLQVAVKDCGLRHSQYATLGDGGHTLILDGDDDGIGGLAVEDQACVLVDLKVTDAVVARMDSTNSLAGEQEATWGDYTASWTYHPDNGFDLIVTEGVAS